MPMLRVCVALVLLAVAAAHDASSEEKALAPFGDSDSPVWLRVKRSCGACCGGGSCCGLGSPCASSCCQQQLVVPLPPPCACGSPGCACGGGCRCGMPGCSCGVPSCACGAPGCSCSQTSLVIPVQTCCKCCQPVCTAACVNGGGCACGCNRGGCRRKRDLLQAISAVAASVPATDLLQ